MPASYHSSNLLTFQEHLSFKVNVAALFGSLESANQRLVVLFHLFVVEQSPKLDFGGASNALNVGNELQAFLVQTFIVIVHHAFSLSPGLSYGSKRWLWCLCALEKMEKDATDE